MGVVDKKVKRLLKIAAKRNHRLLFVILGSSGFKQIPTICELIIKVNKKKICTLWCSKEGNSNGKKEDIFNDVLEKVQDNSALKLFHYSYNDVDKVSTQSFNLAVLHDFEIPSLIKLNFILSTVEGGGAVVLLLPNVSNLEELRLLNLNKDDQISRFSNRFVSSLNLCSSCMIFDENLILLSSSKTSEKLDDVSYSDFSESINELKSKFGNDNTMSALLSLCLTRDQAELLFKYLDVLKKRTFHAIVTVSSAFGRGKSAALGLAIAGSLAMNYSNIFISSSCYNNVNVLFQFLLKGLDALNYKEDKDYDLIESVNPKFNQALIGINVFRDHPQSVRFIFPGDVGQKLEQAELVVIDEAASIPLHQLKPLIGPYIVFMSSTVSGANATSPYLYDTMIENLEQTSKLFKDSNSLTESPSFFMGNALHKVSLKEPIHYNFEDEVESWINQLFCLSSRVSSQLSLGCPETQQCQLFCLSRDVLFNGSILSEKFLQSLLAVFNQSSYVMKPEDFLTMADSPNHEIFVLLTPFFKSSKTPPEVLCAILVHLEFNIPLDIVHCGSNLKDSVPKCFNDWKIQALPSSLQGVHILNIATHPCYKRMGYGLRAIQLLQEMCEQKFISLEEKASLCSLTSSQIVENGNKLDAKAPLLMHLSEVKLEHIEYMFVSFNLTTDVFRFWRKAGFIPLFLKNEKDSGSNICYMMKSIAEDCNHLIQRNWINFRKYYFVLLNSCCQSLPASFALQFLNSYHNPSDTKELTKEIIDVFLKPYHMKCLERYCVRLQDLHLIIHIIPVLSRLYFEDYFKGMSIPFVQEAILLSFGLQNKSIEQIAKDLSLQNTQVVGLLNRTVKKITNFLTNLIEKHVETTLITSDVNMEPLPQSLDEELGEAADQIKNQEKQKLIDLEMSEYAIKGHDDEWIKALSSGRKTLVSIKSIKNKLETPAKDVKTFKPHKKKKKK